MRLLLNAVLQTCASGSVRVLSRPDRRCRIISLLKHLHCLNLKCLDELSANARSRWLCSDYSTCANTRFLLWVPSARSDTDGTLGGLFHVKDLPRRLQPNKRLGEKHTVSLCSTEPRQEEKEVSSPSAAQTPLSAVASWLEASPVPGLRPTLALVLH